MRSNDAYIGVPHDFFCFTMLQEIVSRTLSVEPGSYKHFVGSLHLYDRNLNASQQFLDEGIQSTTAAMPPMPQGDPWAAIQVLLAAEEAIRSGQPWDDGRLNDIDPYWADLIRLLQVYRSSRENDCDRITEARDNMASSVYDVFIDQRLNECRKRLIEER